MARKKSKKTQSRPVEKTVKTSAQKPLEMASANVDVNPADITITFTSGLGQATVSLFRMGIRVVTQTIKQSGDIHFPDVRSGDSLAVNCVCTGKVTITINASTDPPTPTTFSSGAFNTGYDVL